MNLDKYFSKKYSEENYNCSHFLCEVWMEITGQNISDVLHGFSFPKGQRFVEISIRKSFVRLREPVSPCVALFHTREGSPHVGMFYEGRILHIRKTGVHFQPPCVAKIAFRRISYYAVKENHDIQ